MPTPYFHFKKFSIFQDRCAMKVGTDGILLGAWANTTNARQILDIGTGTGLIALMLAQRSHSQSAQIDAVEIDSAACEQARENFARSPWVDRIHAHHGAIQDYASSCLKRYDLIVSNPPFFENASKAIAPSRTMARHNDCLDPADLLECAQQLLQPKGKLAVIYPTEAAQRFQVRADAENFCCDRKLSIQTTPDSPIKRIAMEFGRAQISCQEQSMAIEVAKHIYSMEYTALTKDFYLDRTFNISVAQHL